MILTDSHAHLYSEAFDEDRELVIARALQAGVKRFFIPAIDSAYTEAMLSLERKYPAHMYLMMGLHPTQVKEGMEAELEHVETMLKQHRFYAVGEIGIDLYWDRTHLNLQRQAFLHQLRLAHAYQLPVVIHCRDSFEEICAVLDEAKEECPRGIFHCFTGSLAEARKAISYNMKLGIGGVLTYKNAKLAEVLKEIDLKHLVLETDAPYLAPVPYRGKRNESAYLVHILGKLAEVYGREPEEIAALTTENTREVFGI